MDRKSFLAGLQVGLTLGRPEGQFGMRNAEFGIGDGREAARIAEEAGIGTAGDQMGPPPQGEKEGSECCQGCQDMG